MRDETIYKIAIAAYLHDIGKFAQRAEGKNTDDNSLNGAFYPSEQFLNDNKDLYQPHFNNIYTHKHAVYTAAFIDHFEKVLPEKFNKGEWGLADSFANLAAGHHLPKTPLQWLIAIADRVSSGFDRDEFEEYNAETGTNKKGIKIQDYKKTRLLTIFEGLSTDEKWKKDSLGAYSYRYPLKELSPSNIFPLDTPEIKQVESEQDFIFTEGGSTGKASAKLLRGRSFYVSLLSELAAGMLCSELGLPVTSIILNAAGKFTIIAHNTEETKRAVSEIEVKVNTWLIKNFYGQASMGFSTLEASCNDFVSSKFAELWESLSKETDRKKYLKFDLAQHGGCVETYLDSFDNELGICPFCAKRPADKGAQIKDTPACRICRDHEYIGKNLVKESRIAITTITADLEREKLLEPIFGNYQLSFKVSGKLNQLSSEGSLLKYWDIGITDEGIIAKDITAKFINGYVPKYEDEDLHDDRYFAGRRSEKKKLEMIEQIRTDKFENIPKTFAHIAVKAVNFTDKQDKFKGIEALGILKADVDNLGLLFACGMREERLTLSRLATMSRQFNNYFSIFLPHKLKTDERFRNIYTIFAGGDDLFLIGPWNRIIDFAGFINKSFKEYVCQNEKITISAGVALHKPNTPVVTFADTSEHALSASKSAGRNSITAFGQTVKWDAFEKLEAIKGTLNNWLDSETVNNAMLFRLNELLEMAGQAKEITESGVAHLEDMECLKWRSRFKYTVVRNIGKKLKGEDKEQAINEVMHVAEWLETHGAALKIPLWQIIYNRR